MSLTHTEDRLEVIHENPVEIPRDMDPGPAQPDPDAPIESPDPGTPDSQSTARPTFTITDAAAACSVSRKTITRKLSDLADHGAAKDDDGVWRIPVEALLAVGLHPGRSVPEVTSAPSRPAQPIAPVRPVEQETVTIARDRWDDLRIRLARAEAEANERAAALADARLALRALTAGPSGSVGSAPQATPAPASVAPPSGSQALVAGGGPTAEGPTILAAGVPAAGPSGPEPAETRRTPFTAPASASSAAVPDSPPTPIPAPADTEDLVAARNLAARTGGYVPATVAPAKKRRWWQSH